MIDLVIRFLVENILNLSLWVVVAMFGYILKRIKKIIYIGEASKATLRYIILEQCTKLIERGYITTEDIEGLAEMNEPYCALGGNGTTRIMVNKVEKLPVKNKYE